MTGDGATGPPEGIGRAAVTITLWNLVSRLLGFVRVLATAGALGVAVLGDTYHRSNQVSNLLFELLAGGMLFAVLVPTFVDHLQRDPRHDVGRIAGAIATRATAAMAVVVVVGLVLAEPVMRLLTAGAAEESRAAQVDLGVFFLWFVLPQLLFYAIGAVASAVLQGDRRFVATSMAPACNSLIVTVTMVVFAFTHDPGRGLALTTGEKVLLGGGTLLGTVVMTAVPLVAASRAGLGLRPGWSVRGSDLRPLVGRGLWAAGHVGLNQVLVLITVVLASQVAGGVIAYQTAFTFFLLPHALLAHPIFTALYPRLAGAATAGDTERFSHDLARGLRAMVVLVLPAAAILAAVAAPALSLVQIGQLDDDGVALIAAVLAAYLVGVGGYSTFFLLTRASYALGDARRPTEVNLFVTVATVAALVAASSRFSGTALLVSFGLATALTATIGSVALHRVVVRQLDRPVAVAGPITKAAASSVLAAIAAWGAVRLVGWDTWTHAAAAVAAGGASGGAACGIGLWAMRSPDLDLVVSRMRALRSRVT